MRRPTFSLIRNRCWARSHSPIRPAQHTIIQPICLAVAIFVRRSSLVGSAAIPMPPSMIIIMHNMSNFSCCWHYYIAIDRFAFFFADACLYGIATCCRLLYTFDIFFHYFSRDAWPGCVWLCVCVRARMSNAGGVDEAIHSQLSIIIIINWLR